MSIAHRMGSLLTNPQYMPISVPTSLRSEGLIAIDTYRMIHLQASPHLKDQRLNKGFALHFLTDSTGSLLFYTTLIASRSMDLAEPGGQSIHNKENVWGRLCPGVLIRIERQVGRPGRARTDGSRKGGIALWTNQPMIEKKKNVGHFIFFTYTGRKGDDSNPLCLPDHCCLKTRLR